MDLLQLRYFQTVARLGNITRAAEYYGIPQPAMSQTISRLERDLNGVRLFDRSNSRIQLSQKGRQFLEKVDRALAELDDGIAQLMDTAEAVTGTVHLLVMENRRFAFQCVMDFAKLYPDVNFTVSHEQSDAPDAIYDLCIHSAPGYRQMTSGTPLIREKLNLNVNEKHWAASRESVMLSEMKDEKFISMSSAFTLHQMTYSSCRSAGFEPNVPFICDDPYYVRKYVSENMGVALAPAISWAGRHRSNTKLIRIINPEIIGTSYLLWNGQRYLSAAAAVFRDFMIDKAKQLPDNLAFIPDSAASAREP